ncbi:GNAT family N-acetyltransferase [Frankia sp. CNm7]|uniref:GNAT family N-acetyltransferase n=1 Tax=Frankia nepalensis TaxID=1836974 RepID=A0A937UM93_9ACTN|nr:GNAT family N-acetyltransferase [Frankia nepalensis]MBL7496604.1 GNAT family N-acetyltransferase [Frankia nepalensis]MBL7513347.1 GNAT family N-acetyltransferase [Frankia nepalensis]MBL7521606.1 GNAT family N-acetyltransferase [Frankia nepalensis]MBL7626612.1 GNAT family N-acetyltransferase [Frankia nepalensis]
MGTPTDVRPRPFEDDDPAAGPEGESESHVLDNPVYWSLRGAHAHLAERRGSVLRYPVDVSPFMGIPDRLDPGVWDDLAALVGPGGLAPFTRQPDVVPPGWEVALSGPGVQLVDESLEAAPDEEAVRLGPADVPDMLALVADTQPGPFLPRTIELGTYLGIRRGGALVAMAGERLHPPGWTEISAVCTDAAFRGQGLATRLVKAVAHGIRARGETPFLHAAADNTNAIRLYLSIGFRLRRRPEFFVLRAPGTAPAGSDGWGALGAGADPRER